MIMKNVTATELKHYLLTTFEEIENDIMHVQCYRDGGILGRRIRYEIEVLFGTRESYIVGSHIIYVTAIGHGRQQIDRVKLTSLCLVDGTYKTDRLSAAIKSSIFDSKIYSRRSL